MSLATLRACLLGNLLTRRGFVRAGKGSRRAEKGFLRAVNRVTRVGRGFLTAGEGEGTTKTRESFLREGKGSDSTTPTNKL